MTPAKAYIASFWTTGLLLALALLLLLVVGALMAFDGEAERDSAPPVGDVVVTPSGAPDRIVPRQVTAASAESAGTETPSTSGVVLTRVSAPAPPADAPGAPVIEGGAFGPKGSGQAAPQPRPDVASEEGGEPGDGGGGGGFELGGDVQAVVEVVSPEGVSALLQQVVAGFPSGRGVPLTSAD